VQLKRIYVCGEEIQALGSMGKSDILAYSRKHPEYEVSASDGSVTFSEKVNDLSLHCKENAYFGLDKDGNLSLFDGNPADERVIRTFFQLNVEHMKSSLPAGVWKQLLAGIRVSDIAEFNSVLSTFSDYATPAIHAKQ
jgi:forespore regulator of the sigma-K checkpoint